MTMRALIVDDEPLARRRLRTLLKSEADLDVVGECEDGAAAIAATRRLSPDLLFLDVQMPGLDGFDVVAALGPSTNTAVIFVTAHDEYALRAFDVHAVDYLLKPFDKDRFSTALERALEVVRRRQTGELSDKLHALLADVRPAPRQPCLERIAVKS